MEFMARCLFKCLQISNIQNVVSSMGSTNFFDKVYEIVKKIPKGKVMTYGQIAEILGTQDARRVGWALHGNTDPKIPCHRVVNKEGGVAINYAFDGWAEQKKKLVAEGVSFKSEKCVDLKRHHWIIGIY